MQAVEQLEKAKQEAANQSIKCVVWDLDHTLWHGILMEDPEVTLKPGVLEVIQALDARGILNSIASKNDQTTALAKLEALGIQDYFLYPEISWNPKSQAIRNIAKNLNIATNTFAFIDDQPFEREEVGHELLEVMTIDAADLAEVLGLERMNPRHITEDSRNRRLLYQSDQKRKQAEADFSGNNEAFLATLDMHFKIKKASLDDLQRAEELTMRTHQLNTTGYTYSYDELNQFRVSPDHLLLVAELTDKYGSYGTIGLGLIEKQTDCWLVKLLLMSCRVMSRGVGTILMNYIMTECKKAGKPLRAEFISNDRNRMMYITYKFANFKDIDKQGDLQILQNDLKQIQALPAYVKVELPSE